jgi:hypothetical protein
MDTKSRKEIKFRNRSTQPYICLLEVRRSGTVIGHVRRGERGIFQYYRGPENFVMYELEHGDLLKRALCGAKAGSHSVCT